MQKLTPFIRVVVKISFKTQIKHIFRLVTKTHPANGIHGEKSVNRR